MDSHPTSLGYFEAEVAIFTAAEGGRQTPVFNGIRWDFALADDTEPLRLFMIWPDFRTDDGSPRPVDHPLPTSQKLKARFYPEPRHIESLPLTKIRQGTVFYCHEGPKRVAIGTVTNVKNLSVNSTNDGCEARDSEE